MTRGHLVFVLRTHAAKIKQMRWEGDRVRMGHPVALSIARSILGVELMALAAPASVIVLLTGPYCLTVLLHGMPSAMEKLMQMV